MVIEKQYKYLLVTKFGKTFGDASLTWFRAIMVIAKEEKNQFNLPRIAAHGQCGDAFQCITDQLRMPTGGKKIVLAIAIIVND